MSRRNDILSFLSKSKVAKPVTKAVGVAKKRIISAKDVPISDTIFDTWTVRGTHLAYKVPRTAPLLASPLKVASFDMDGTIIQTKSGSKFAYGSDDWKWFNESTLSKLLDYQERGYLIVIFTNQGNVIAKKHQKSFINLVTKVNNVTKSLDNAFVFVSPKRPTDKASQKEAISSKEDHDLFRKPGVGMWQELQDLVKAVNRNLEIDVENSFYCGDAAGRPADFSDSDIKFAKNIGLQFFTPEQLFPSS